MKSPAVIASIICRNLRGANGFYVISASDSLPVEVELRQNEEVVGCYRNPPPWEDCVLVFTTRALLSIQAKQREGIELDDIVGYEEPRSKVDVTGIRVLTKTGFQFIRIAGQGGAHEQYRDAYRLIMMIRAIMPGAPLVS